MHIMPNAPMHETCIDFRVRNINLRAIHTILYIHNAILNDIVYIQEEKAQ
jgi:hypothetical protein